MNYSNINTIKVKTKVALIQNLKTGDLIKIKSDFLPIIYHYGIVDVKTPDEIYVYHNMPDKFNSKGGNLVYEPIRSFLEGKDIISVQKTELNSLDLNSIYQSLQEYKYDFINFNCEHFVNFATENKYVSNQVFRWTALSLITIYLLYLIRKNKI